MDRRKLGITLARKSKDAVKKKVAQIGLINYQKEQEKNAQEFSDALGRAFREDLLPVLLENQRPRDESMALAMNPGLKILLRKQKTR